MSACLTAADMTATPYFSPDWSATRAVPYHLIRSRSLQVQAAFLEAQARAVLC